MTNRAIIYSQEQGRSFDFCWFEKDIVNSVGDLYQGVMGLMASGATMVDGFACTQNSPTALTVLLAKGHIYQQSAIDQTAFGALASDATVIQQQGFAAAQTVTISTAGLGSGQKMWALIQCQFQQTDVVRTGDPNSGIPLFWNSANPSVPLNGQGGNGVVIPTVRQGIAAIQVIYGTAVASGSEVPPTVTAGWVPLYLIDLAFGQTTITNGQIITAGPSVGVNVPGNYPQAPFVAGLLNAHHNGKTGQAPKIQLASAAEVQGILPLANLPASSAPVGGGLSTVQTYQGNPNHHIAGNAGVPGVSAPDLVWDEFCNVFWACVTSGNAANAVWQLIARQPLTATITIYIDVTNGDDNNNDGLHIGSAFKTCQRGWDECVRKFDLNGYQVIIQLADGTYPSGIITGGCPLGATGQFPVIIRGHVGSPQNVIFATGNDCIFADAGAYLQCEHITFGSTSTYGLHCRGNSIIYHKNCRFNTCGQAHMFGEFLGRCLAIGPYDILGDAPCHADSYQCGLVQTDNVAITFINNRNFSTGFCQARHGGITQFSRLSVSGANPSGVRYVALGNGVVHTLGQSGTYLPGNAGGSLASGGQYT